MAEVIDTLLVSLSLDSTKFREELKKTREDIGKLREEGNQRLKKAQDDHEKHNKLLSKSASATAESIKKATVAIAGFMLALSGVKSLTNFTTNLIDADSKLELMSKNLRQNVSEIDAWGRAAELAGGTSGGLQQTFELLSRAQTEMRVTGTTGILQYMRALGVDMVDVNRNARPVNDMLVDMAKAVDRLKLNRADAYNIFKMMGLDEGTATAIAGGLKTYKEYMKLSKENGTITKEQAEASRKLDLQFTSSVQTMKTLARTAIVELAPSMEKVFSIISGLVNKLLANPDALKAFFSNVGSIVEHVARGLDAIANSKFVKSAIGTAGDIFNDGKAVLSDLVGKGESGGNYEAYNSGTIGGVVQHSGTMKGLTSMSLDEILKASELPASNPNRIFAAGKYQMTPDFLRTAMKKLNLWGLEKFDSGMQDYIFQQMLPDKVKDFLRTGDESLLSGAQLEMAKKYRSVADPRTGLTYADKGAAANKATISTGQFTSMMHQMRQAGNTGSAVSTNNNTTTSVGTVNIYANNVDKNSITSLGQNVQYSNTSIAATSGQY